MTKAVYDPNDDGVIAIAQGGTAATTASGARANLGLAIGSDVQGWDADLDAVSALGTIGGMARIAVNSWAIRALAGTGNNISVANGTGELGNPTITIGTNIGTLDTSQTWTGDQTFSGSYLVDSVSEKTAANGVSVEGVKMKDSRFEFSEISAPATPAANNIRFYAKDNGGVSKQYYKEENGTEYAVGRSVDEILFVPATYDYGAWYPGPENSGFFPTPTATAFTSTIGADSYSRFTEYVTSTTSGNIAKFYPAIMTSALRYTRPDLLPIIHIPFFLATITSIRFAAGITSALDNTTDVDNQVNTDDPSSSHILVQFSTPRGDTTIKISVKDGSTQNVVDTGVTVVAGTTYRMLMYFTSSSSMRWFVFSGTSEVSVASGTITSNLPASSTGLAPFMAIQTQTAAQRRFGLYYFLVINRAYKNTSLPG